VQDAAVGHRAGAVQGQVERAPAPLPGDVPARLLGGRRDRKDHVGMRRDGAVADFEADDEAGTVEGLGRERGIAEVGRIDATDDQGGECSVARGLQDCCGVASGDAGQGGVPHALDLSASRGVGHRTAAGQQRGQRTRIDRAELAGPARHPGELRAGPLG
jgi:hypothetical protein